MCTAGCSLLILPWMISGCVWSQMNGGSYALSRRKAVPYSVFISPSYSRVGMNETEARKAEIPVKIAVLPAAAIPKAQVLKNPQAC